MCLPVKKLVPSLPPQPPVTIDQTWGNGWTACGVARRVEWPDRTRCPILPWLSYLNNKLDSVSSFLKVDSVTVFLFHLLSRGRSVSSKWKLHSRTAEKKILVREGESTCMYVWPGWHHIRFLALRFTLLLAFNSGSGGKNRSDCGRMKKLEILKYSRGGTSW